MAPRRSHKKSKAGCRRCKIRKIKCDEVHPRCGNCLKHGVSCDFGNPAIIDELHNSAASPASASSPRPSPSPVPAPASSSLPDGRPPAIDGRRQPNLPLLAPAPLYKTPGTVIQTGMPDANNRMLELKLMHNYTAFTSKTLTPTTKLSEVVWMVDVPKLAFSGATYLADAMLAMSALHLRSQDPDDKALIQASHAYMASSLVAYRDALRAGLDQSNSESLFLTASLIAFQSTATRIFAGDELGMDVRPPTSAAITTTRGAAAGAAANPARAPSDRSYTAPLSCFHAFQGVKAVVVSSWPWLRNSSSVLTVIESQPRLQLEGLIAPTSFFGHLLEGVEEECAAEEDEKQPTAEAYAHAVAVLNWAHRSPNYAANLIFPATVARRYVDLLSEGRPRALVILASFFALMRRMEHIWWIGGVPKREVLGIASLFDESSPWRRHLEWPLKIVHAESPIPDELWGSEQLPDDGFQLHHGFPSRESFVEHIEQVAQMMMQNPMQNIAPGFFQLSFNHENGNLAVAGADAEQTMMGAGNGGHEPKRDLEMYG